MPTMKTRDARIDYEVHGEGPPLLLIGGLGFGRWAWFKQVPDLSRRFRVIAFDVLEESVPSRDVAHLAAEAAALLDHLGVERVHVLGTSLGGFVAQRLALDHPDLVDRLVLVCTSYGGPSQERMSLSALGRMLGWGSFSPKMAARRGMKAATSRAYRARNPEEFDEIVRQRLADSPSLTSYFGQVKAGALFDASHEVGDISSPALVIHGSDDRYVPVSNAYDLARAIPNAGLRVFDDAGHLVFIERAEEVNEEIVAFLEPQREGAEEKMRQTVGAAPCGPHEAEKPSLIRRLGRRAKKLLGRLSRRRDGDGEG